MPMIMRNVEKAYKRNWCSERNEKDLSQYGSCQAACQNIKKDCDTLSKDQLSMQEPVFNKI